MDPIIKLASFECFLDIHRALPEKYILRFGFLLITRHLQHSILSILARLRINRESKFIVPFWMLTAFRSDFGFLCLTAENHLSIGVLLVK